MRNRILNWLLLRLVYPKYVKDIDEASRKYALGIWKKTHKNEDFSYTTCRGRTFIKGDFCSIEFAFIDGYNKALYDNGLKFEDGKVVKDIERFI